MTPPSDPARTAHQAVGNTPVSRAQWLLKFSQLGFQNLGPDGVTQLRGEVAALLNLLQPPNITQVRQWQRDLKRELKALEQGQEWKPDQAGLQVALRFNTGKLVVVKRITPLHQADQFMLKAAETLANAQDSVRQCAREDCKQLFIGTEKRGRPQNYCSVTCRGTVGKRRYRQHRP